MFLQLGNIVFDKANSPNSISEKLDIAFAQHDLINQRPRLQPTGRELEEHTYSLYLHRDFSRVQAEIDQLKASAIAHEVLPMLWGNGTVAGNFVITSLTIGKPYMSGEGDVYAADVEMTLEEFPVNPVTDRQAKADKKAYATGTNKAVTGRRAGSTTGNGQATNATCAKYIANQRRLINGYGGYENQQYNIFFGSSNPATAREVGRLAAKVKSLADATLGSVECVAKYSLSLTLLKLSTAADQLAFYAGTVPNSALAIATWKPEFGTKHTNFQAALRAFYSASSAATANAITRAGDGTAVNANSGRGGGYLPLPD